MRASGPTEEAVPGRVWTKASALVRVWTAQGGRSPQIAAGQKNHVGEGGRGLKRIALPAAVWLLVWQGAALLVGKELLLPGPMAVFFRLGTLATTAVFWQSVGLSLLRVFGGFALGATLAVLIAAATCACSWADWILAPAVRVVRATPVASFIILLLLWADKGMVPAIVAGLMVLPVVWENVSRGVRETDPLLLEMAAAYRFGPWRTVRLIYIPSALPYLASGCRTALGLGWKAGVAAEVLCLPRLSVGTGLYQAKLYLESADLFAWTVAVVALSLLLERLVGRAMEKRMEPRE